MVWEREKQCKESLQRDSVLSLHIHCSLSLYHQRGLSLLGYKLTSCWLEQGKDAEEEEGQDGGERMKRRMEGTAMDTGGWVGTHPFLALSLPSVISDALIKDTVFFFVFVGINRTDHCGKKSLCWGASPAVIFSLSITYISQNKVVMMAVISTGL